MTDEFTTNQIQMELDRLRIENLELKAVLAFNNKQVALLQSLMRVRVNEGMRRYGIKKTGRTKDIIAI